MQIRKLGRELAVSAIGYGAMGLSEFYGQTEDGNSLAVLRNVVETGVTLIDTADIYGRGHNERLCGHFLATLGSQQRDQMRIATKCGIDRPADKAYERRINNQPDYIRQSCHASLQRLGVERIDLYYLHRVNPDVPVEESMQCLAQLVNEGKIAHVGLCEVSAATLERAHRVHPVTALQTEYSLWTRDIEQDILPAASRLGIGVVAYSPLGRGFLTGRFARNSDFQHDDFRKNNPRFSDRNLKSNSRIIDFIAPLAKKYQCTPGQLSLAWLLAQYEQMVPIPGTKHCRYAEENAVAASIRLSPEDVALLTNLKDHIEIKGQRYSLEGMKGINA